MNRFVIIAVALALLAACNKADQKQSEEEAINRGEAVPGAAAAAPQDEFITGCTDAGGVYNATAQHCTVTAAMCASLGEWRDGVGCVMPSMDATACTDMSGLRMVGDVCVITYATRELITTI